MCCTAWALRATSARARSTPWRPMSGCWPNCCGAPGSTRCCTCPRRGSIRGPGAPTRTRRWRCCRASRAACTTCPSSAAKPCATPAGGPACAGRGYRTGAGCRAGGGGGVGVGGLSNVVGPGMDAASGNLLASLVQQARQGHVQLRSDPRSVKDYLHLADLLDWLPQIALTGRATVYNVASGLQTSHAQWLAWLQQRTGCTVHWPEDAPLQQFAPIAVHRLRAEWGWGARPGVRGWGGEWGWGPRRLFSDDLLVAAPAPAAPLAPSMPSMPSMPAAPSVPAAAFVRAAQAAFPLPTHPSPPQAPPGRPPPLGGPPLSPAPQRQVPDDEPTHRGPMQVPRPAAGKGARIEALRHQPPTSRPWMRPLRPGPRPLPA